MREWRFDVSLDGKPIGEHRFVKHEFDDRVEVTSEANFRVRFLFIDAYRYEHRAYEMWRGDCLERLDARTDDNGEEILVSGERAGRGFRVTTDGVVAGVELCVQTFAYWNPRILEANAPAQSPDRGIPAGADMRALDESVRRIPGGATLSACQRMAAAARADRSLVHDGARMARARIPHARRAAPALLEEVAPCVRDC